MKVAFVRARRGVLVALLLLGTALATGVMHDARAAEAAPAVADPTLEARVLRISAELRCLVCQNQTIADSNAELANDLRSQVRTMLRQGKTDQDVLDYMTARYGDFVLYRPPVKATTVVLWAGPAALLVGGLLALALVLRRRSRLPASAFERDEDEDSTSAQALDQSRTR